MSALDLADNSGSGAGGALIAVIVLVTAFYFLPTIVAAVRHVPNVGSVAVINLFFGWTLIGWVVSLSMAARSRATSTVVNVHSHGGGFIQPQYQPQQYSVEDGSERRTGATAWMPQQTALPSQATRQYPAISQGQEQFAIPPGWHPDPSGAARQRYWDGQRWTDHTA